MFKASGVRSVDLELRARASCHISGSASASAPAARHPDAAGAGPDKTMLRGSPGSRFTSGSNRFRACAGAAADARAVRCLGQGPAQDRTGGGHGFSYWLPRLRIAGSVTYIDERGKPTTADVSGSGRADRQRSDLPADQLW